jgi:hypothetical protein
MNGKMHGVAGREPIRAVQTLPEKKRTRVYRTMDKYGSLVAEVYE